MTYVDSLIVPENFIQATRDTGYRSLAAAVSEIVDNALDARAREFVIRVEDDGNAGERHLSIAMLDDGLGMSPSTLREALRFGGSRHFADRDGFGRFGMGLPNSSLSQCSDIHVYSWQRRTAVWHVQLDASAIASGRRSGPSMVRRESPPPWINPLPERGTLVLWRDCDRVTYRRTATIRRKLVEQLGRIYRVPLSQGFRITIDGTAVRPVDPLFRVAPAELARTSHPFGKPLVYAVRSPNTGRAYEVSATFVLLPVEAWHALPNDEKRRMGLVGGAGVSVLRGDREIDHGWYFFGSKRRENYDDWWRCELRFHPALDEIFGVTHSKQGINPTAEIRQILEPDLASVARDLNSKVRSAFKHLKDGSPGTAEHVAERRDALLPHVESTGSGRRISLHGYRYRFLTVASSSRNFMDVYVDGREIVVELNKSHPFYSRLYARMTQADRSLRRDFELLLFAAGRALLDGSGRDFLTEWSDNLLAFLGG